MRVIYFSFDYSPHDHRFLSALAETEHEVFFLRLGRGPRQVEDRPVPEKIEQLQWEGGKGPFRWRDVPRYVRGLRRLIRSIQPDLIHAGPLQTSAFIAVLSGFRPVLSMSWGFDLMEDVHRSRWWEWVTRYVLGRSAFFTSDARVTRDKAVAYGMHPERTIVFPWGVDLRHFAPGDGQRPDSNGFTLFCNRSWEPRYGVDVLANAFVMAARQREDLSLLLLGGGSQGQLIRQTLERGGVAGRVTFAGQVSQADLPRWYNMADLYISPSHVDGSSVSLMEALACGLPALVSDIPANCEWVADSENGWLFPDGDAGALAGRILSAMDARATLPSMARAARATAEERADWTKNFAKLLTAYQLATEV